MLGNAMMKTVLQKCSWGWKTTQHYIHSSCCSVTQLCPPLQPHGCSLPGSSVCGTSMQEYRSGMPFPPRSLPDRGLKPVSPALARASRKGLHAFSWLHLTTVWRSGLLVSSEWKHNAETSLSFN